MKHLIGLLAAVGFVVACDEGGSPGGADAGLPDSAVEVAPDAASDTVPDAAPDVEPGTDPGSDTAPDPSQLDAPPPEAGPDTSLPPHCCKGDSDCDDGQRCVGGDLDPGGWCVTAPSEGECHDASDCPAKHFCWGAGVCSCLQKCAVKAGECLPLPGDCCDEDADCAGDPGYVCARIPGSAWGVCELAAPQGRCWNWDDCPPDHSCEGAQVCGCDADCSEPDRAGTCTLIPGCCTAEEHCGEGDWTCAMLGEEHGVCKPKSSLQEGRCWWSGDCDPGQSCIGAALCPCNADCDMIDMPGACSGLGCCDTDDDCEPGETCIGPGAPGSGTCQPALSPGQCWTAADCYGTQECVGAFQCPCMGACAMMTKPGECSPLPQGCCDSDADCPDDAVCRGAFEGSKLPGRCVADPLGPACMGDAACCWEDADCFGAGTCQGAVVCGCIDLCPNCGACAPDQMGFCSG